MTHRKRYSSLSDYIARSGERQIDLAKRLGVSQATISRICNGGPCSLQMAKRVSAATGVPMESFGSEQAVA